MINRDLRIVKLLLIAFIGMILKIQASNPIITNIYTADPAAMVYGDSVYLYTGHDEASASATGYVMNDWHVFSTGDMVNWKDHGEVLKVSDFSWASRDAWAAHTVERNGKFYWYVTLGPKTGGAFAIGVAVSDSPIGPFTDAIGAPLITDAMTPDVTYDIDPAVFIDDNGQAYLYWGNGGVCKVVKLKENMIELDGSIFDLSIPLFTEASYLHKRNSVYYFTYASGWPETIAYATSNGPFGPFIYKGTLNALVSSTTNHQSVIEFKDQWYFIYHTGAIGGDYQRSVCVDYLFYNADGTIKEIVQTDEGVEALDGSCMPAAITSKQRSNGGNWSKSYKITVVEGDSVEFSPEVDVAGKWNWTGPNGFTDTNRVIKLKDLTLEQGGLYKATFTRDCGTKTYMKYTLGVMNGLSEKLETNHSYVLFPKGSELAVSVKNGLSANGTEIVQSAFTKSNNQIWKFVVVASYYYWVQPQNATSRGIDVNDFSLEDDAKVQIWDYWGGTTQQWQVIEVEPDYYKFIASHSGKCLDAIGDVTTEGARIRQMTCDGSDRQLFKIVDADELVGMNYYELKKEIIISPNPVKSEQFTIIISGFNSLINLEIIDLKGSILFKTDIFNQTIINPDIKLSKGIYFVKMQEKDNIYTRKLVVK